ncbi:major antigen-like isoform X1 [Cucurbita moschata]|uniref:Major antigen-like isoform X1 n=2 Tax=Cucurbita moschata TaxID=3662 RepID=A0A6J1F6C6_CUCMO|nr:major antigen-like isoform X1 [Cucurbita moschata]
MDKNKSRSDLLAAGRKKLQQFRKKKDNRGGGSQGNSSKNTSKLEQHDVDADIVTASAKSPSGSCSTDEALSPSVYRDPDAVDSSASPSMEHSLAAEIDHSTDSVKQEMDLAETSAIDQAEVPMQEVGYSEDCEHPIQNTEAAMPFGLSLPTDAEENDNHICNLSSTESSPQISSASVEQQGRIAEVWGGCREEELLPSQSASLLQAREDVGMEDVLMQSVQAHETEFSGDKQLETGGMNESAAETTFKDRYCDKKEIIAADVKSVSGADTESNSYLISSPGEKLGMKNSSSSSRDDWKEESQVHAEDMIQSSRCEVQYMPEDNFADQSEGHDMASQTSDAGDANAISHNAHMTSTSDASGTFSSFEQDSKFLHLLERMKEELIVTSFSKDIFNLQISEQNELQLELDNHLHKSTDDMTRLNTSLDEVLERNQSLVDELSHCRSELKDVLTTKEELRDQLLNAEAEIEKLSSRTSETENSLEKFHGDMFRLGKELDDCKHLVTVLEEENERLNGIITSENENKRKLAEEKELYINENEKILSEISSFKSLKMALEVENSKLMGSLSEVVEEKTKLEEEREHLCQMNGTLSVELSNCKNLVATQQEEITDLIKNLALATEDRTKLEEDKNRLFHENERIASELLVLDERLSTEHEERVKLESDLKDALAQLDQLTEENIFLSNNLDIHIFKIEELCGEILSLQTRSVDDEDQAENTDSGRRHGNKFQGNDSSQITFKENLHEISSVLAGGKPFIVTEQEIFDDSLGLVTLGQHLEEADLMLQKLEKEIKGLQSNSASFSSSGSKMAAPAVSKLIQAFESKVNVEEQEVDAEIQLSNDPYKLSNELVDNLRVLLRQVVVDSEKASVLLKGERDHRKVAISTLNEFKDQFEDLENHSNDLVMANIEHSILFECLKHHVYDAGDKIYELEILKESLKQQGVHHKNSNCELAVRLCGYKLKLTELESQLCDFHQGSNETVSLICNQLDNLQEGEIERGMTLEKDWHSFLLELAETIAKLDESLGNSNTSAIKFCTNDQLPSCIATSVKNAVNIIDDLRERLQATASNGEAFRMLYEEVNEKYDNLFRSTELSVDMLRRIYGKLQNLYIASCGSVSGSDMNMQIKMLGDPLDYSNFETLIKPLEDCITERLRLESLNDKLRLDLEHRTVEFVQFRERCLDPIGIQKLIKNVQSVLLLEDTEKDRAEMPAFHLETMVSLVLQKYRESELQLGLSREECGSVMMKLTELQESVHDLSTLILDHECEIVLLKESLSQAQEALMALRSELKDKVDELEQSEQRVSAIRDKLSIAVAKGKGLIVQRDNLKQLLAQTSSELERCLQELQMKDTRLHEVETKLNTYSEAGERVEALESELSYIRNSATALRESFLLKDSVLQRIEEILDELDLPENFHSRDIIEKIDWLAKSSAGENIPHTDWDQRSSVAGGSGSDANFVITDAWKDEVQPDANVGDDLRRKYEELQTKFYGLAEQNEMLEQSLMERNNAVQRWEELLEKIDIHSHLRSMEPEDKIEWLNRSLSEACHDRDSLHQRVNYLENYCGSLTADLDDSRKKISDIEAELQLVLLEREKLSEKLEIIDHHNDHLSFGTFENEIENIVLQNELSNMQEKLISTELKIVKLEALVGNVLQDNDVHDLVSGSSIEFLELMVMKLVQNYTFSLRDAVPESTTNGSTTEEMLARSVDAHVAWQNDINVLKKDLEDAMHQLMVVTKERDRYMEMHEYLVVKVESIDKKKDELQELLNLEEQKSTSIREKLNVAVRKGKSLVQQRDSLKQAIEEMTTELKNLRSEMKSQENTLASYEQKLRDFSVYTGRVEALESENLSLKNQLTETKNNLQEKEFKLSSIINTLVHMEVNVDVYETDPIEKLKQVGKLCSDLREAMVSSEQESVKSRRAAELLLAELNEVQERNDAFQEELAKASDEIAELTKERDLAETSKLEALSELEKLSTLHLKERKNQFSKFMGFKSGLDQLKEALREINCLLADAFSRDLDAFYNLEVAIESCTKANDLAEVNPSPSTVSGVVKKDKGSFFALDTWLNSYANSPVDENVETEIHSQIMQHLEESIKEIGALKEMIGGHSVSFHKRSDSLSKVLGSLYQEVLSQKELVQALELDVQQRESVAKDKEKEGDILCRNIAVLSEACTSTIKEIDQRKGELMGNDLTSENLGMDINSPTPDQLSHIGKTHLLSEEYVRRIADRLLITVREFIGLKAEMFDGHVKEMKAAIANLQKELQEKDIQNERVCMELVGQIKEAEATATRYSLDLQASKDEMRELQKVTEQMESERKILEQRLREMRDGLSISDELRETVRLLTDSLAAKDQEIEALMHALDEEEEQMEGLTNKIEEQEKVLKQKNQELESIETSRGKLTKKLSLTVTKFDELHHLSESLLTEVEKLQAQLQDRDAEVSFLRQEVTRCTNDALVATQTSNRSTEDINEVITWFDMMEARVGLSHIGHDDQENGVRECKEVLKKKITSILKEIEDLQAVSQRKDALLLAEKNKVEELKRKELQLNLLEDVGDGNRASSAAPEIFESEPLINKWAASSTSVTPQVPSLRKGNTDQVAIAIDMDPASSSNRLEDEDDDKVHGFKSLASSRIVPKFSRRATDMIDGLWVSCDRALMRQPALRLGIIFYWAILHALLATFVV